ncbi:MAG TPA: hypothetical protein VE967_08285 [Gemmatimonadaceae bacterium]|nr:hypothetical protein [Gemmatimonadaceae bacterium]
MPPSRSWTVAALIAGLAAPPARAQITGTLTPRAAGVQALDAHHNDVSSAVKKYGRDMTLEQQRDFAVLVNDITLTSAARASIWTASIVGYSSGADAKIQFNLCDIPESLCKKASSALSLTLAGPVNKDNPNGLTDLASFDGLAGKSRAEVAFRSKAVNATWQPGLVVQGSYSRPSFAFRNAGSLAKASEKHDAYTVSAGIAARGAATALELTAAYEDAFRAKSATSLCTPLGNAANQSTCESVSIGAPGRKIRRVVGFDARRAISQAAGVGIAFNHDVSAGVTSIDLPVWVIPAPEKGLGAGVRFSYATDTKETKLTFFVGTFLQ